MAEDISLRATGATGDLERTFEGAEESVRRSMEAARDAVESLDVSQVGIFKLKSGASCEKRRPGRARCPRALMPPTNLLYRVARA